MPSPPPLPLTGERTLPGIWHENYWFRRHEAVYAALAPEAGEALILEIGCGEGYGPAMLARHAARVVAVDYDPLTALHARRSYPMLDVVRGNAVALPIGDARVDLVVALQVVEHLWEQEAFVQECARVLRPGGRVVLSTPNRLTFSPGRPPVNPCHTRELAPDEMVALLRPVLTVERLLGLHHGPRLDTWERRHGGIVDAQLAGDPAAWPGAVRDTVTRVSADDFELRTADLERSLDLVAIATRRHGS